MYSFPPSLDSYSLSISFPGRKPLCIVFNFIVPWFICLTSALHHFKNGPENLIRGTAQVFIRWMRFLLQNLVSRRFLVRLRYDFLFLFLIHIFFDGVSFQYSIVTVFFSFSPNVKIYEVRLWLGQAVLPFFFIWLYL